MPLSVPPWIHDLHYLRRRGRVGRAKGHDEESSMSTKPTPWPKAEAPHRLVLAMKRKSKLTIAIGTAALAILGSTAVYSQDKYSLQSPSGIAFSDGYED
jgi:hypothetical protein